MVTLFSFKITNNKKVIYMLKNKLIKQLKDLISTKKEGEMTVKLDDESSNIYAELLIPFMELTQSETLEELSIALNALVDNNEADELYKSIITIFMEEISEVDEYDKELDTLSDNIIAVSNTFNNLKEQKIVNDDKTESTEFDKLSDEIVKFLNEDNNGDTNDGGDVNNTDGTGDVNTNDGNTPDNTPSGDENVLGDYILSDDIDETKWSEINKIELKNRLETELTNAPDDKKEDIKKVINEVYAIVRSDDKADQLYPHHTINDKNEIQLNKNGLTSATLMFLKPSNSKNLTTDEKTAIAKHLVKHYSKNEIDAPAKLTKLSESKESTIIINVTDDEMTEFGEFFKVGAGDVGVYVGLIENLLTDLTNSGIIQLDGNDDNSNYDESVISVKLNKDQVKEVINYLDIISTDVIKLLSNDFDSLSYKATDDELTTSFKEATAMVTSLKENVEELESTIAERDEEIASLKLKTDSETLNKSKFEAIINFIKTIEDVDDNILNFMESVIETNNENEINYLLKLSGNFMKQTNKPPTFKKVSMINQVDSQSLERFNNILNNDVVNQSNNESTKITDEVSKTVNSIAELF